MKTRKAPQLELPSPDFADAFNLAGETMPDPAGLMREKAERDDAKRRLLEANLDLFPPTARITLT